MLSKIAPFAGLYTLGTRGHWRNARAKHTRTTQTSPYTHALHGIKSTHPECNNLDLVYIYQRAYLCVRSLSLSFLFSCSGSAITGCLLVCTWECAMASTIRWWRCGWGELAVGRSGFRIRSVWFQRDCASRPFPSLGSLTTLWRAPELAFYLAVCVLT